MIIVFDALCILCSAHAQFVVRHDRSRRFKLASLQSQAGQELYRRFGLDPSDPISLILVDGDQVLTDSDAVVAIWAGFGGPWKAASTLHLVPRALRDPVYRWFARNRYRMFGKHEVCWVPGSADRGRFL